MARQYKAILGIIKKTKRGDTQRNTHNQEGDHNAGQKKTKGLNIQGMTKGQETDVQHSWGKLNTMKQRTQS